MQSVEQQPSLINSYSYVSCFVCLSQNTVDCLSPRGRNTVPTGTQLPMANRYILSIHRSVTIFLSAKGASKWFARPVDRNQPSSDQAKFYSPRYLPPSPRNRVIRKLHVTRQFFQVHSLTTYLSSSHKGHSTILFTLIPGSSRTVLQFNVSYHRKFELRV